jgi:phosphate transport system substrate-binding protein
VRKFEEEIVMAIRKIARFALIAAAVTFASTVFAQKEVRGSGATFPSIIYSTWAFGYSKEKGVPVKYAATGSGEGVRSITAHEVDFGATDVPLTDQELKKSNLIQFPTVAGGIVPVVNLPGVATIQLKLTGAVLADIFSGKIKLWNDPQIVALNDGVKLSALKITRVVRDDSSGTTEAFTTYLAASSPDWKASVGRKISWSGNVVALKGTDAIAQAVKDTSGAIGYVSFDRVSKFGIAAASLRNRAGQFVAVSENSIMAAVRASALRTDLRASLIDINAPDAWPLVDATYILVDANPLVAAEASRTLKFFYWAFLKGDEIVRGTGFAPLPVEVQARVVRLLAEVKSQDKLPIDYMSDREHQTILAMR